MGKREIKTGKGVKITAFEDLGYYHFSKEENKSKSVGGFGFIKFQEGLVEKEGVNGCSPEDTLKAVLMQLDSVIQKNGFTQDDQEKYEMQAKKYKMLAEDIRDIIYFNEVYETEVPRKAPGKDEKSSLWSPGRIPL